MEIAATNHEILVKDSTVDDDEEMLTLRIEILSLGTEEHVTLPASAEVYDLKKVLHAQAPSDCTRPATSVLQMADYVLEAATTYEPLLHRWHDKRAPLTAG